MNLNLFTFTVSKALSTDLSFLSQSDLSVDQDIPPTNISLKHIEKISTFLKDSNRMALVAWNQSKRIGMLLARFQDASDHWLFEVNGPFENIPPSIFYPSQKFAEVFNIYVDPSYRRLGVATRLKSELEDETKRRNIHLIYTHTLKTNPHVVNLNLQMGYQIVREGPIWDSTIRISMLKRLK